MMPGYELYGKYLGSMLRMDGRFHFYSLRLPKMAPIFTSTP